MRRPAVVVLLAAGALALAGCGGGSLGDWKAGPATTGDVGPGPTTTETSASDSALATCLVGTWSLDENALTSIAQQGFLESLSESEDMTATLDSLTADQTLTFVDDETFSSQTQMTAAFTFTYQGQTIPASLTIEASSSGTWRTSGEKLAITTTNDEGTMHIETAGQPDDQNLDSGDLVLLPSSLDSVACRHDTLIYDSANLGQIAPGAPDNVVYTRQ